MRSGRIVRPPHFHAAQALLTRPTNGFRLQAEVEESGAAHGAESRRPPRRGPGSGGRREVEAESAAGAVDWRLCGSDLRVELKADGAWLAGWPAAGFPSTKFSLSETPEGIAIVSSPLKISSALPACVERVRNVGAFPAAIPAGFLAPSPPGSPRGGFPLDAHSLSPIRGARNPGSVPVSALDRKHPCWSGTRTYCAHWPPGWRWRRARRLWSRRSLSGPLRNRLPRRISIASRSISLPILRCLPRPT